MNELGEFLESRRAKVSPDELGLPAIYGRRRVPGLRREELAQAAGVSVDHYVRLEQGRGRNVSESVLDAIARVLRLADDERAHLHRLALLDEASRTLYPDWEDVARETVAYLRLDAARYPDDPELAALVGELSIKSPDFRRWWAGHDVRDKTFGTKRMVHPVVGELSVAFETLRLAGEPDQCLVTYTVEPGSASEQALRLLASWTAPDATPLERADQPPR